MCCNNLQSQFAFLLSAALQTLHGNRECLQHPSPDLLSTNTVWWYQLHAFLQWPFSLPQTFHCSWERKASPHPVPWPSALLLFSPACPAQHLILPPLQTKSFPAKIKQTNFSYLGSERSSEQGEQWPLFCKWKFIQAPNIIIHRFIINFCKRILIYNAMDFATSPLRSNHTLMKYSPEPSLTWR